MKQVIMLKLPARRHVPETSIYSEVYTKSGHLGQRDVLMLMPGGPGNDHTVCDYAGNAFAEALLDHVDVILFDPRSCGQSEKSPIEYCTLEHYIDDVEAIHNYYKIPYDQGILMGVSYGAIAALGYAIKYQSTFKKLILVCGSASGEFIQQARQNLAKIGTPEQQKMGEKILTGTFTLSPETMSGYYETMGPLYSCTFKPGLPTPNISYNLELANLGFRDFLKNFDYRPKLSQVKCQTLLIAGEHDWISDRRQAEIIHRGISGSKLMLYQHCSHMIWIDQWERFLHDIINFLS
jgi:proline iminopeptidase